MYKHIMESSTDRSILELNIELQFKVKELTQKVEEFETSRNQYKEKLESYKDLSQDLLNMRAQLKKATDLLMKRKSEVDNLKGLLEHSEKKNTFLSEKVRLLSAPQRKSSVEIEQNTTMTMNSTVDLTKSVASIDSENVSCVINTFNYNQSSNYCMSSSALSNSTQQLQLSQRPLGFETENKHLSRVRACHPHPRKSMSTENLPAAAAKNMRNAVLQAHLQMSGRKPPTSNKARVEPLPIQGTLKRKIVPSTSSSSSRKNTTATQVNGRKPFRC